jgi:hypothetical protein
MTQEQIQSAIRDASWYMAWRTIHYDVHLSNPEVALFWCCFRKTNRVVLTSLARGGWQPAHLTLCNMAKILTLFGDPLPKWLQEYIVFAAEDGGEQRSQRGQSPLTNLIRDMVISIAVESISQRYLLRPTRNSTTTTESGCSIVAKSLELLGMHMSEANVVAIWRTQRRLDLTESLRQGRRLSCAPEGTP